MHEIVNLLKPQILHSLSPMCSVFDAAELMAGKRIGSVIVLDGLTLVGIFTERDMMNKVVARGKDPKTTILAEVMTQQVKTVKQDVTLDECYQIMTDIGCRHLPVVDDKNHVVAIISIRHVLGWMLQALETERDHLRNYIAQG